jgi:signal transduction histidine kinase
MTRHFKHLPMARDTRALNVVAIVLAIVTLLGSVLVPARLTSRIIEQLDGAVAIDPEVVVAIASVRALEQHSLIVNAALVVVALAAVGAVIALTRREQRLAGIVRRRLAQESALREAAESLAQALTIEEVTSRIVQTAVRAGVARGAFVEHVVAATPGSAALAVVEAAAGTGMPAPGASRPYASSYAKRAIDRDEPIVFSDLLLPTGALTRVAPDPSVSGIVVPLAHATAPIGALFLVHSRRDGVDALGITAAHTFGKLAALAYEKARLLEEAREGGRRLARAMKSRSQLMRGFSHDVKNPLGAADGYADLLMLGVHGDLTSDQRRMIQHIRRCIQTALGLIDDLHQLGRIETGRIALHRSQVDLASLLRALREDYEASARARGLSLAVEIDPDLPGIDTDRARVREIVDNFLSNAIKYTPSGSITLRLRGGQFAPGETIDGQWIDVVDTGPGIQADKHQVIFEEFTRLDTAQAGAGVGLAISKLLSEALDGRISLVSRPGCGSTFSLWVPRESAWRASEEFATSQAGAAS